MMPRALVSVLGSLLTITLSAATLTVAAAAGGAPGGAQVFDHIHALAFDPEGRTLWLGAHTGLFTSEDGGLTWTKSELPVTGHAPDVMAIACGARSDCMNSRIAFSPSSVTDSVGIQRRRILRLLVWRSLDNR